MHIDELLAQTQARLGQEVGPTAWREVLQSDISAFGSCTYDPDPMHVDPDWATAHSPFGTPIAFGYWTLSMLTSFFHELAGAKPGGDYGVPHEERIGINYGCERLRFIEPVRVGARIRMRSTLAAVEQKGPDRILTASDVVVDIEGSERPALVARWLAMTLLPEANVALDGFRRGGAQ